MERNWCSVGLLCVEKQQMQSYIVTANNTVNTLKRKLKHIHSNSPHMPCATDKCDKFSYGTLNTIIAVCMLYMYEIRNCDNI